MAIKTLCLETAMLSCPIWMGSTLIDILLYFIYSTSFSNLFGNDLYVPFLKIFQVSR